MIIDTMNSHMNQQMELIQQVLNISLLPITSRPAQRRRPVERPRVRREVKIRRDS
jgi:hypothetical protein